MRSASTARWRTVGLAVGAFVVFDLLMALAFQLWVRRPAESRGSGNTTPASAVAEASGTSAGTMLVLPSAQPPAAVTSVGAPRRRLLASDADPRPAVEYPTASMNEFDPFVGGAKGPSVRTLVSQGAIRVGVSTTSKINDEAQVTRVLGELAKELDEKEQGRSDSYEARAREYQPLLKGYADRLHEHMDGDFAFHGEGWILFQPVKTGGQAHAHP
jgi:hypothetical protein